MVNMAGSFCWFYPLCYCWHKPLYKSPGLREIRVSTLFFGGSADRGDPTVNKAVRHIASDAIPKINFWSFRHHETSYWFVVPDSVP